jgi:hypothetical protein
MNTKIYVCILAGAALVVSSAEAQRTTPTPRSSGPIIGGTPVPIPVPGKRTETGTVIDLDPKHIVLKTAAETWDIKRTAGTTVTSGTLKVGSTIEVTFDEGDGHTI